MRPLKTFTIGACLLAHFVAVLWSIATILNGGTIGEAAVISKNDAVTAIVLLAISVLANVLLTIALFRRRGLRKQLARPVS